MVWVYSLEPCAVNTRSFQVKKLSFTILVTISQEDRSICTNSDRRVGHKSKSMTCTKTPQKAENLSKMVRGALFGIFCSQY